MHLFFIRFKHFLFAAFKVNEILAKSSIWSAFKDQKHDLFISESQTAGYLTGKVLLSSNYYSNYLTFKQEKNCAHY